MVLITPKTDIETIENPFDNNTKLGIYVYIY